MIATDLTLENLTVTINQEIHVQAGFGDLAHGPTFFDGLVSARRDRHSLRRFQAGAGEFLWLAP